jgi:hypothetical protein
MAKGPEGVGLPGEVCGDAGVHVLAGAVLSAGCGRVPGMSLGTVVMTGAAGSVGSALREPLRGEVERLVLVDRVPLVAESPVEHVRRVDLSSAEAAAAVVEGADAVVHLAGSRTMRRSPSFSRAMCSVPTTCWRGRGGPASDAWCWPAATG